VISIWFPIAANAVQTDGAATSAWIAAGASLAVGGVTVLANLWIARNHSRLAERQPMVEQSAASAHQRDGRIRRVLEATERIRIRCWEVHSVCRHVDGELGPETWRKLDRQTELLTADSGDLYERWPALRPDLSENQHDHLLAGRIVCMEALDALVTTIAVRPRLSPPEPSSIRDAADALDGAAGHLVDDLLVIRRTWASGSGVI
jgi:hypothetical protein